MRDVPPATPPTKTGLHVPDQFPAERSSGHPTTQASHEAHDSLSFRRGIDQASRQEAPRLPPKVLYGVIFVLVAAIGFAFAPWVRYELADGTSVAETGIRGDGLVMVLAALIAIGALAFASRTEPGGASFPALIGLGACVLGLLAVGYTMMDPGYIQIDTVAPPVALTRGWGLIGGFLTMLVATLGTFRLWRVADHF